MATLTLDTAQGSLLDAVGARPARTPATARRPAPQAGGAPRTGGAPQTGAAPAAPSARTLDDLVTGAWSAITVTQTAACPLCGGDLVPRFGSGPQPVAGACRSCGTELS